MVKNKYTGQREWNRKEGTSNLRKHYQAGHQRWWLEFHPTNLTQEHYEMGLKLFIQVQKSEDFNHWQWISIWMMPRVLPACTRLSVKWVCMRHFLAWHQRSPRMGLQSRPKVGLCLLYLSKPGQSQHERGHWHNGQTEVVDKRCQEHCIKSLCHVTYCGKDKHPVEYQYNGNLYIKENEQTTATYNMGKSHKWRVGQTQKSVYFIIPCIWGLKTWKSKV